MRLYSMPSSGNSYKIRLALALTGREAEVIDCENGSEALTRAKAEGVLPYGKVPALVLDDGRKLGESDAILWYLGEETSLIPSDPVERAQMLGWMFWEQYNHEPVIAVRQALLCYPERASDATPEHLADLLKRGHAVLQVMEERLVGHDWLIDEASLADLCLYAYTHSAGTRGGFEMDRFPAINAWLRRVEAIPGYVRLDQ
ncbi:glutathione S-transferase family protein [Paracoccus saliphilus]|uniref:Glutathione S-transferase n=1 Tax=Paracoccus saliphilus TaxID=405559 RepID=A0AA45W224_9RHOB|nr:glutathione S-transferase family protein [Paracoccus saliphilus]WCR01796.1 glutathione S-transferase family protein [Paracoccus saliphilus]SIS63482.1 glutathione S-transferase [Paracoccus saliphilus]